MNKQLKTLFLLLTINIFWFAKLQAAPLTFNTALPVSTGESILREQLLVIQSGDDPSGMNRDRTQVDIASTLVYGITPDLAIFGSVPYTDRRFKSMDGSTRLSQGLGDSKLFARYTIYKDDFQGGSFRIAPFTGVKLPTGDDNEQDVFGLLPANVQTGSGTWDTFGGLVATYGSVDWEVDAQLSYQVNNKANNFEKGNSSRADISFQYRLFPETLSVNTEYFINGVLEANFIKNERNRTADVVEFNSGGSTLFLVPGLQYVFERYIVEVSLQVPVAQNLNGSALENNYVFRTGFRINF